MSSKKDLEKLIARMNKKFGENAMTLGCPRDSKGEVRKVKYLSTGSLTLNVALGGGIPLGRFTEISGSFSASKSTQALHIIKEAQKIGLKCALLDVEGTTDDKYLETIGVNVKDLIYMNPDGTEEATQALLELQRSEVVHLAVLDSFASLSPTKEYESDMDETVQMGLQPKILGEYFRKYTASNNRLSREGKEPFTLIGLNQLRESMVAYGDPTFTPGGKRNALQLISIMI